MMLKAVACLFMILPVWISVLGELDPLLVQTTLGTIRGVKEYSEKGDPFFSYYSIPYAKPPLGKLRFQDPVEADSWEGVWDGTSQPEPCIQMMALRLRQHQRLNEEDLIGSEDCLYLNVFTPEASIEGDLAVMVFLHGGANLWGSARDYPPHVLLNHRVVLVVPQHRLGTMGFLSTEDSVMPGNLGLKDQSLALRWVKRNICFFGGDPGRVTVFGESAGGFNTHLHVLSPKSAGLFSRVILQSGTALSPAALTEGHRKMALEWADMLGCPQTNDSREILSCLQRLDARKLAVIPSHTTEWFLMPGVLLPRVDGDFLPADPALLVRQARHSKVDLITGITAHDGSFIANVLYKREDLLAKLRDNFTVMAPYSLLLHLEKETSITSRIFQHYLGGTIVDVANSESTVKMYTDVHMGVPSDLTAQLHAKNVPTKKTFIFQLMHRGQRSMSDLLNVEVGKHWVSHADDLIYLFSGGPMLQNLTLEQPDDLKLRDIMTTLWVNFANTGMPTPDDSLGFIWEEAAVDNLQYLSLTPTPSMHPDSRSQVRRFFRSLPTNQNLILNQQLEKDEAQWVG